jgi:excisionase family DNA binding protein
MQASPAIRTLLTALEVQDLLHIDRSTVYRMAEDGRLPAIRVGHSWRFPAERIASILVDRDADPGPRRIAAAAGRADRSSGAAPPEPEQVLDVRAAQAAIAVAAGLLGVMMVVTDMSGRPLTGVANPCPWFAEHGGEPGVLDACVAGWRDLAEHPDLTPRLQTGVHGFQCARAFIRHGHELVGMVLAGGVSPSADPAANPDLFHLDAAARARLLDALPSVAAAISTASTVQKEN